MRIIQNGGHSIRQCFSQKEWGGARTERELTDDWKIVTDTRDLFTRSSRAVVQWCSGAVAQWRSGAVVQWCSGAVAQGAGVQWCSGAGGQWFSGTVAQWCSGAVVQWRSGAVAQGAGVQWRSGAVAQWRSGAVAQWREFRTKRTHVRILCCCGKHLASLSLTLHCSSSLSFLFTFHF